ncbi:hypothetical protein FACS189490_00420 [Clostridia bacterium]|nr:hypothetical protein FACS189490_00420 [Clostridia bacterium]
MTAFVLKIIASVCMLLDHIGAEFPSAGMPWLRWVGRIAFPIYAYMIAQGCKHTKNINKYLLRLGVFALISEIPFDIAFQSPKILDGALSLNINFFNDTNVFYSLFFGAATIAVCQGDSNFAHEAKFKSVGRGLETPAQPKAAPTAYCGSQATAIEAGVSLCLDEKLKTKRRVWPAMLTLLIVPAALAPAVLLQDTISWKIIFGGGLLVYLAAVLWLSNTREERPIDKQVTPLRHIAALIPTIPIILLGNVLGTDYGMYAIIYILFFYLMKPESRVMRTVAAAIVAFAEYGYQYLYFRLFDLGVSLPLLPGKPMQDFPDGLTVFGFALIAAVLVFFYNGKQGKKAKWAFYWFYPAHMVALAAIWFIIYNL